MKTCSKCGETKEFSEFHKSKARTDGHTSNCKNCLIKHQSELKENPIKQLEREIKSSIILENKILCKEGKRICSSCKKVFIINGSMSGYRCLECNRKYQSECFQKYKKLDKFKEYKKQYFKQYTSTDEFKEKKKEKEKIYREKNKEKIREYNREYKRKKKLEKLQSN